MKVKGKDHLRERINEKKRERKFFLFSVSFEWNDWNSSVLKCVKHFAFSYKTIALGIANEVIS